MNWIFAISLLVLFEIIADIFSKEWSLNGGHLWFFALLAYLIANTFWLFALKGGAGLGKGGMIFVVACAIMAVVLGVLVYKEPINKTQIVGVAFGILSLTLILWE